MTTIPNAALSFVFLFFSFTNVVAQTTLAGKVQLEEGEPAIGAFVSIVSSQDTLSPIDYTVVDTDGSWEMQTTATGTFFLKTAYMGYKTYLAPLQLQASDSLYFDIVLTQEALAMPEVEVNATAIDIVQKGDTLRYNVKKFLTGSERTLGDIIEQLPGFELDENSKISYKGKQIDKLLIEGKDILNDQHQLASEGIQAEDILALDIIEHFKDKKALFNGEESSKVALNIDLDNKGKTHWSSMLSLGGGYKNKYKGDASLLGVDEAYGLTVFAKGNNTGQSIISSNDYMNLLSPRTLLERLKQNSDIEQLVPTALTIPSDLQQNKDGLVAINGAYTFSENTEWNIAILGAQLNRTTSNKFVRSYLDNQQLFVGDYQQQVQFPFLNVQSFLQYEWKKRLFVEVDIPFNIHQENKQQAWAGFFQENPADNKQLYTDATWDIFPEVSINLKLAPKTHLVTTFSSFYKQQQKDRKLEGIDSLFQSNLLAVQQFNNWIEQSNQVKLSFHHTTKTSRWGINGIYSNQLQQLENNIIPFVNTSFLGENRFRIETYTLSPYGHFKTGQWHFKTGLQGLLYQFVLDGEHVQKKRIAPNLSVRYNFSELHFLFFSTSPNYTTLSLKEVSPIVQIEDGQTLRTGTLPPDHLPFRQNYSLNYVNLDIANRSFFNATLSWSKLSNVVANQTFIQPSFIQIQSAIQAAQTTWNASVRFHRPVFKRNWQLKTNLGAQYIESSLLQNEQPTRWTYQGFNAGLAVQSTYKAAFNYKLGLSINTQNQTIGAVQHDFSSIQSSIGLDFHQKNWTIKNKWNYTHFITAPNTLLQRIHWNIEIWYKPTSKPYSFGISGVDILNLQGQQQMQASFNPIFVENNRFTSFSGFVLAEASYTF